MGPRTEGEHIDRADCFPPTQSGHDHRLVGRNRLLDFRPVPSSPPNSHRPLLERVGLGLLALLLAGLFALVAVAAWTGGEPFLAAMAGIGCLMTAWAGGNSALRG